MSPLEKNSSVSSHPVRNPEKLAVIQESLRKSTIRWMKRISESNQEAREKHLTDHAYLQINIWYADDLLKGCLDCKQNPMADWIRKNHFQLIGRLHPDYFDKIKDGQQQFKSYYFIAKKTVLASEALQKAIEGLSIIDCGMACQISLYGALLDVLGIEKFNRLFSDKFGQLMNLNFSGDENDELQPMRHFTHFPLMETIEKTIAQKTTLEKLKLFAQQKKIELGEMGNRPIKIGQIVAIGGVKDYKKKYPYGRAANLNAVCCDDTPGKQKFIGLGLNPEGATEAEIRDSHLEAYNKSDNRLFLSPKKCNDGTLWEWEIWDKKLTPEQKEFAFSIYPIATEVEGLDCASPEEFKAELIYDLLELPLEEVSMNFVKQHSAVTHGKLKLEQLMANLSL